MIAEDRIKSIISSTLTGGGSPEETLSHLAKMGIEWYVTEEGTLMIKYWRVGAENFVEPEHAAVIRSSADAPEPIAALDWLGQHLDELRQQYGGQWIAVYSNQVIASATEIPRLMSQIEEYANPFVTFIPAEPTIWNFTYAH